MKKLFAAFAVTATLVGCGVPDSAVLSDLDSDDWTKMCSGRATEERTETCDYDGVEVEVTIEAQSEEDCVDANDGNWDGCDATAGDYNACADAMDSHDICSTELPAACDAIAACWETE